MRCKPVPFIRGPVLKPVFPIITCVRVCIGRSAGAIRNKDLTTGIGSRDTTAARKHPNIFKRLVYVYIGTSRYEADYKFYRETLDARLVWEFKEFGARVAAFDLCGEPYLLIADHVPAPSKRLIYQVEDLDAAARELKDHGWKPDGGRFEVPDGPCMNFKDISGNEFALLQMTRPHLLDKEFLRARQGDET